MTSSAANKPTTGRGGSGGLDHISIVGVASTALLLALLGACGNGTVTLEDPQLTGEDGTAKQGEGTKPGEGGEGGNTGPVVVPPGGTKLQLAIDKPARGATLNGPTAVNIEGQVTGKVKDLTINGTPITAAADGSFTATVEASYGMNLLIVEGVDGDGVKQRLVQSFYYSGRWLEPDPANPAGKLINDAVVGWLGQPIFDHSDPKRIDIANVVQRLLAGIDVASMVPSSQRIDNVAGCDHADIKISNFAVNPAVVSLSTTADGIQVKVTFTALSANVKADLDGKWYNPACHIGVKGKVKASVIEVKTKLDAWVEGGQLKAKAKQTTAQVHGFNIDISGIWGFLTNWLVNKFEDDIEKDLEKQIASELDKQMGPVLAKGLADLSFNEKIEAPPIIPGANEAKVAVQLVSRLRTLDTVTGGIRYTLGGTAVNKKPVGMPKSKGAIGYAGCAGAGKALAFREAGKHPLQLGVSDDLINQMLYSFHQGGLLRAQLTQEALEKELGGKGITDLEGSVEALLPPILNSCEQGKPVLQIGDLRVKLKFNMIGMAVEMEVHAALEVPVKLKLAQAGGGKQRLHLSFDADKAKLEVESKDLSDGTGTVYDTVEALLHVQLAPELLKTIAKQEISLPIPEIDLASMQSSIPKGTKIRLKLARIEQRDGYTVVVGGIQ
jgi:hypothetical protein